MATPEKQMREGNIRFIEKRIPSLMAGEYELTIDHEIKVKNTTESVLHLTKKFTVSSERFQLAPEDIHSCFPPENAKGNFSDCLPHIVLKNSCLPWVRSATDKEENTPWLVLLLFYEDELSCIKADTIKLKDINRPPDWLDTGEDGEDQCVILEVSDDLLNEIVPKEEDLQWLCHVREVSNERKEDTVNGRTSDYAVIMANRLPQQHIEKDKTGILHRVHLVSIEEYYRRKDEDSWYQAKDNMVQLVSLKSWEFRSEGEPLSFKEELNKLDQDIFRSTKYQQIENPPLKAFLAKGYTLLRHQMRQGDKTVSLYRSPLVPCSTQPQVNFPIACADEAVHFYPDLGLFDVTYATAWQLGRLLALQNNDVSTTLLKWKREMRHNAIIEKEQEKVKQELGITIAKESKEVEQATDWLDGVSDWFAKLKNLSDIPTHYLIPDAENMLPQDSIRFFYIDPNWTKSLIDGVCSVGRAISADLEKDKSNTEILDRYSDHAASKMRKKQEPLSDSKDDSQSFTATTGFIIRSEAITTWPGMEIQAYNNASNRLPLISLKRLTGDVLICLFKGELQKVDIHQPTEGLHYNLQRTEKGIKIRVPSTDDDSGGDEYVENKFIGKIDKKVKNVIDVALLAEGIRAKLRIDSEKFTSAQFALAMLAEAEGACFQIGIKNA